MKNLLMIMALFGMTVFAACETYEDRRAERSEERVQDFEYEEETAPAGEEPLEVEKDTELGEDEVEIEQ